MCGIIGAIAQRNVVPILVEGLRRLEYRGYDSSGLAILNQNKDLQRLRRVGRVQELASAIEENSNIDGQIGFAHTRWATHGIPSESNAHPHMSNDEIVVVHNGIIENYATLRDTLQNKGYIFTSETDTEVIAHLVHDFYKNLDKNTDNFLKAVQDAVSHLEGSFAIALMSKLDSNTLVCARKGSPLLIGLGIEEHFCASDISALLPVTQRVIYLEEGDIAVLHRKKLEIYDQLGNLVKRPIHQSELSADFAELGEYRHFMQKEIYEQPTAVMNTLQKMILAGDVSPDLFGFENERVIKKLDSVKIIACGTSYHSGLIAKYWIEHCAKIRCDVEVASEYRYRESVANPNELFITISQSGETADTLAGLKHAQSMGYVNTLAICNVPESSLIRLSKYSFLTQAGPEIGVASTKAFTTQLVALFMLSLLLGKARGQISVEKTQDYISDLRKLPNQIQQALLLEKSIKSWAYEIAELQHALFLGRGTCYPIAMEGALKLKEISYIHAEAYPAGELKHGPLALVDQHMPIIAVAPNNALLDKMQSNLQEVQARGGTIYLLTAMGVNHFKSTDYQKLNVIQLDMPKDSILAPIVNVIPLQLLAYHSAVHKGTDVDKPRNLAKSVTVE